MFFDITEIAKSINSLIDYINSYGNADMFSLQQMYHINLAFQLIYQPRTLGLTEWRKQLVILLQAVRTVRINNNLPADPHGLEKIVRRETSLLDSHNNEHDSHNSQEDNLAHGAHKTVLMLLYILDKVNSFKRHQQRLINTKQRYKFSDSVGCIEPQVIRVDFRYHLEMCRDPNAIFESLVSGNKIVF